MSDRMSRPPATVQIRIDHHSAVHIAATQARGLGERLGLTGARPDQAATVASELATNLDKYGREGIVYLQPLPLGEGLEILAVDRGPGMSDPGLCLTDGYTTSGTLGTGLGAVRRIASDFRMHSRPRAGTVTVARVGAPSAVPPRGVGAICVPADGEEACGDGYLVREDGPTRTVALVDGLGHGPDAARATRQGLRAFAEGDPELGLSAVLESMHRAMRHTRGAAVGVLRQRAGELEFCAVGNVRLCVMSGSGAERRMEARPGIVGWNMPTPHTRGTALGVEQMAVIHSDGIEARWTRDTSPLLWESWPETLPAVLSHRHRRSRDDASAVALAGLA
ncbi:SpoIIE family protein phosphatase [Streptomyces sp. NPDC005438]|uniref:SpoIIE family protein phosphatase n=1 Tax=Streptomyces sp. NPDC005438 TaxID=3156880 RepID=UPI0033AE2FFA